MTDQMFCVAISFKDTLEKFKIQIQNPHFQVVLMTLVSALLSYPQPSNRLLKPKKLSEQFLPVSSADMFFAIRFCIFKQRLLSSG
jgi:hypothetical protein